MPRLVERTRKRNSSDIYSFIHFIVLRHVQVPSTFTIHAKNPFLSYIFLQDHLRSRMVIKLDHLCSRIICGSGGHLRYCTTLLTTLNQLQKIWGWGGGVNFQLLKLQLPLRPSYLHLNLHFSSSHHL